ncbi:MAG: DUF434 domain-containing protein [Acidobacteriota bacterium]
MAKSSLQKERLWVLAQAAADFFFFQNRRYPRASALEWVGNRYELSQTERHLLHRGVFGQREALARRAKHSPPADCRNGWLVVDGHNVQITVESFILGRPLLKANDGALRDMAGQSADFRFTEVGQMAIDMIFRFLDEHRPKQILVLFDAPMSHSGLIAGEYKKRITSMGLKGDARAVPVPEREFPYAECIAASSDQEVLDSSSRWLDLARLAIETSGLLEPMADFSSIILSRSTDQYSISDFGPF